jgi:plasmid stability protein
MALVQIRGVDDRVRDELKARAASRGVSLNAFLVALLEEAARRPSRELVLDRIARRLERSSVSSTDVVRRGRGERSA